MFPACLNQSIDVGGEVPRKKNDDVPVARGQLRSTRQMDRAIRGGGCIGIDPGSNAPAGCGRANCARHPRQANAAGARLHLHWPGHIHDPDAAAARLSANGAPDFAEINLAAAGTHADQTLRSSNGNVATVGFEIGAPADLPRADVSSAAVQQRIPGNISGVDVSTCGERIQITSNVQHLYMSAFGFQFGHGMPGTHVAVTIHADASRSNIPTLGGKVCGAADILRLDVAATCFDLDAVTPRDGYFKLHPELRSYGVRAGHLRRKGSIDFY